MTMTGGLVVTERHREDRVTLVKINRPDVKNALSPAALTELHSVLTELALDDSVRVVVLAGEGGTFTTGDDLSETARMDANGFRSLIEGFQSVTRAIRALPPPVVAAVNGWAVGGGLEIAANCDIRVVGDGTRFFCPEVSFGLLMSNASSLLLPRLIGAGNTRHLMLSGRRFDAAWAERVGFAQVVVPESEVVAASLDLAGDIAGANPEAVRATKRLFNRVEDADVEAALNAETEAAVAAFARPEVAGALRAELDRWLTRRR